MPKFQQPVTFDNAAEMFAVTQADAGQIAFCRDTKLVFTWDGVSTWMPSNRVVVKKSGIPVNGLATGNTKIYTLETIPGMVFYPTKVIMRKASQAGTVITQPVVTIGSNAPSYDNIATNSLLTSILGTLSIGSGGPGINTFSPPLASGADIYARISTTAIGPTALTFTVDIEGYYDAA